jgi:SurA-like protein
MSLSKLAIVVAAVITLSACGTHAPAGPQLTVNGHPVSIALYNSLVAAERQKIERTGVLISSTSPRQASIEASVIRELVRDAVIEQLATARGIAISAAELQTHVLAAEHALGGRLPFEQALEQAGLSRGDFGAILRYRLLEAQLDQSASTTSGVIDGAIRSARVVVTIGPCASRAYPSCVTP